MIRSKLLGFEVGIEEIGRGDYGRYICRYEVKTPTGVLFTGDHFSTPRLFWELESVLGLLYFLCENPDTSGASDEFFSDYTPDQFAWARSYDAECASGEIQALEEEIARAQRDTFYSEMNYGPEGQTVDYFRADEQGDYQPLEAYLAQRA